MREKISYYNLLEKFWNFEGRYSATKASKCKTFDTSVLNTARSLWIKILSAIKNFWNFTDSAHAISVLTNQVFSPKIFTLTKKNNILIGRLLIYHQFREKNSILDFLTNSEISRGATAPKMYQNATISIPAYSARQDFSESRF